VTHSYNFGNKGVADDLSAMTFDPKTNKLFVIKNSNNTVYVFHVAYNGILTPDGTFVIERNAHGMMKESLLIRLPIWCM
jgi:hypothetical protein